MRIYDDLIELSEDILFFCEASLAAAPKLTLLHGVRLSSHRSLLGRLGLNGVIARSVVTGTIFSLRLLLTLDHE